MRHARQLAAATISTVVGMLMLAVPATAATDSSTDDTGPLTAEYVDKDGNITVFGEVAAGADSLSTQAVVTSSSYPWQTWAACGASTADSKLVRAFSAGHAPMTSVYIRTVNLRCGNATYGYRHILAQHATQWQTLSNLAGGLNWRYFADWAIAQSLASPYRYCQNTSANTLNYVGLIQFRKTDGTIGATYYPRIPTGKTSYNIITAFPQSVPTTGC